MPKKPCLLALQFGSHLHSPSSYKIPHSHGSTAALYWSRAQKDNPATAALTIWSRPSMFLQPISAQALEAAGKLYCSHVRYIVYSKIPYNIITSGRVVSSGRHLSCWPLLQTHKVEQCPGLTKTCSSRLKHEQIHPVAHFVLLKGPFLHWGSLLDQLASMLLFQTEL